VAAGLAAAAGSSGGTLEHNHLSGLQGGGASERYHLTNTQLTNLLALLTVTTVNLPVYTVATLPGVAAGHTAYVTDAATTLTLGIGTIVVGGGANKTPVWSDGTNWRYG
jgi:hypothetical protein